jgi:hypothetical protein
MRTSFSLLARETPRTCAVSAGEAKSVVMTTLAIASSDNNRLSSIPSILMSPNWPDDASHRLPLLSADSQCGVVNDRLHYQLRFKQAHLTEPQTVTVVLRLLLLSKLMNLRGDGS